MNLLDGVCSSSNDLTATLAVPDTNSSSLDRFLATERANVSRVLRNLDFLDLLPQTSAITGAVFAGDADLLRAFPLNNALGISMRLETSNCRAQCQRRVDNETVMKSIHSSKTMVMIVEGISHHFATVLVFRRRKR